ncbi:DUF4760 domain-containing protein [Falsiroseomonas sp. E2-1-a20]|uniref:DUF4760 domain-containing protein n=1 Tax=Falsiroseomonas sp. E2-1-a20 TaxID=3239300 RepID=UPI003F3A7B63
MAPLAFWWVQPAVVAVGIFVAGVAIYWNRRVARLKATLDLIEGTESKEYYQKRYRAFRSYRRDPETKATVLNTNLENNTCRDECLDFLNHYELVAISCKKGIIDADFYKMWMGPVFIRDWNEAWQLINSARMPEPLGGKVDHRAAYCEFETLALSWGGKFISNRSVHEHVT